MDNRYSLHILGDIQRMDHHNIQANKYMHQRCFVHGIQHLFRMDWLDKQSPLAHDKLKQWQRNVSIRIQHDQRRTRQMNNQ